LAARPSQQQPLLQVRRLIAAKKKQLITDKNRTRSNLSLVAITAEPDNRKSSHKAREALTCKKRPDSKKAARSAGNGSVNKKFVPWC
jgi:hypothetical protein